MVYKFEWTKSGCDKCQIRVNVLNALRKSVITPITDFNLSMFVWTVLILFSSESKSFFKFYGEEIGIKALAREGETRAAYTRSIWRIGT